MFRNPPVKNFLLLSSAATLAAGSVVAATGAATAAPVMNGDLDDDIRVMSFNVHHGADGQDVLDLERIAQDIEASDSDIIGLQEVDNHWSSRSDFVDQAAWLADRLGMHYSYAANLDRDPVDGQPERRQYGTAILSEYPILDSENHLLTSIEYAERPTEQRGLLEAVINVDGSHINFYNTHLDHQRSEQRQSQVKEILAIADDSDRPSVLVGDLNAIPSSPEMQDILTEFTDTFAQLGQDEDFTYPVGEPDRRIDYILTHGDVEVEAAEVIRTMSSDHLPVIADLDVDQAPNGLRK
ncbi:endonuclease/exonuclease/phosphatase [Arthrobacter crystallopoietes BAB-32]|uniref:Endonuclease/exonuclease/phosphatase n=1 Tax=Arthrobacter crystallopoietes BAB-32 TaxID=1246476 RepID=N1V9S7_9MICC|nr:endonuclease/exonuclease/phosphatase family protein [Arthrobacter crystallopoietes]EMY35043.1 endonuclease/exonuclease/phosphatase [Arthrobacter crystallopoietes BAB-32]